MVIYKYSQLLISNLYLGVFFIVKKKGIVLVSVICFTIVLYGFITISNSLPKFIKDRSSLKINYNLSPFDFRVDMGEYSFYVNKKVFLNIKNSSVRLISNIEDKVYDNTSNFINSTSNVFKNMENRISDTIQNKVK